MYSKRDKLIIYKKKKKGSHKGSLVMVVTADNFVVANKLNPDKWSLVWARPAINMGNNILFSKVTGGWQ